MSQDNSEPTPVQTNPNNRNHFFTFANCASLAALVLSVIALTVAICSGDKHEGRGHYGPEMHKRFGGPMMNRGYQEFRGGPGSWGGGPEAHDRLQMEERMRQGGGEQGQGPRFDERQPDFRGQPGQQGEGSEGQ